MKKLMFIAVSLLLSASFIFAQSEAKKDFSKEIDEQVWKPFSEAYGTYDAEKYIALHTDDVLRVTKWGGIKQGNSFRESIMKSFSREDKPQRTLNFEFEHRIHSDDVAYEVGYYESVSKTKEGEKKAYYGRFHVVLKKVNGQWKIAQDWDTSNINGEKVTATDFERLKQRVAEGEQMDAAALDKKYLDKVKTLDSTIETLYSVISGEAGEARDWNLFRYLFQKDAKLIPSGKNKAGKVNARYMSPNDYVRSSGKWLVENGFFEKEIFRKTETYGNITQVFSTYESFKSESDEQLFMRGINSIQLLHDGTRWWIVNIFWTNETKDTPLPKKYLQK